MGQRTCSIDGCEKPAKVRGWCGMHSERHRRYGDPLTLVGKGRPPADPMQRFWSKVDKGAPDECWRWRDPDPRDGYGKFWTETKHWRAHRFAYEQLVGPIPDGMTLDHTCHDITTCAGGSSCPHRACVNPAHLEPVTDTENLRRGLSPFVINARKTHCIRGHEFTPENTYTTPSGTRHCRACVQLYRQGLLTNGER